MGSSTKGSAEPKGMASETEFEQKQKQKQKQEKTENGQVGSAFESLMSQNEGF